MKPLVSCLSLVLSLLSSAPAGAQPPAAAQTLAPSPAIPPAAQFTVGRAASAIKIDGVLDEPAWQAATIIPLPYEYQPSDNATPPVKTDCLITYDQERLYIGFRASDPSPREIRAHLMDRDSIDTFIQDDHVGLMIDTFNDERRGYQFRVNPLGVQADAIFSELDGIEDWSWDSIWASAGRIGSDGYVVEIAMPLSQLRFAAGSTPQTWGFEAFRSYPRTVRHRISSRFTDRNKGCILCQENKVTGFQGMLPGRALELDPTVTARRTDERPSFPEGPLVAGKATGDIGLTARWGVTSNLTLSAAANPDFSQVEADVAQLDVNTRFALFYPEKRPFFLEGVDYFATPLDAVFTRTVADPLGGLKLTGKQGADAIGIFVTRDRTNSFLLPSNQESDFASTDDEVTGAVLRYRRDVAARSTLGFLYAGREAGAYHNRVIGPDAFLRVSSSDTIGFQALWSDTAYPEQVVSAQGTPRGAFGGSAVSARYQHVGRGWIWQGKLESLGRQFRADSGFMPRVDTRTVTGFIERRFWGSATSWFTRGELGVAASRVTDQDGMLTDQSIAPFVSYGGPYQAEAVAQISQEKQYYRGVTYDLTRAFAQLSAQPTGVVRLAATVSGGDEIDVVNGRRGSAVRVAPSIEWKAGRALNVQLNHTLERLSASGSWLYTANLTQLRAVVHLNVHTFLRAILQYTDVSRDPARFIVPVSADSRHLFSQFLFSYKLNPQTVLLVGYSDNYSALTRVSLIQGNRTFFFKVGYAWVR